MNPKIQTRVDSQRGCGWRKEGGLYLISGGVSAPCGMLPIPLTTCPTCSCGIKPSRGWTWVDVQALRAGKECSASPEQCFGCPMQTLAGKQGLLWIGGKFYEKPEDWTNEAIRQGVSRRISAIPRDFKLGETWVLVAHRAALETACTPCQGSGKVLDPLTPGFIPDGAPACAECEGKGRLDQAAIFHAFKPSAIEYVTKGTETDEEIEAMIKRGITPVKVQRDTDLPGLDVPAADDQATVEEEDETAVEA